MSNDQRRNPRYVVAGDEQTVAVPQVVAATPVVERVVQPDVQPVAVAPVVQPVVQPVVAPVQPVVNRTVLQPVQRRRVATWSSRRVALDSVIVGIVGLVMLTFGLVVVARAGLDGPMNLPVVEVLGFTATATLGFVIGGLGLCLLICAATTSRSGAVFFGVVLGVAGFVGAVQTSSFRRSLALESSLAWIAVVAAVVVVLVSLLVPRTAVQSTRVETI